MSVRTIFVQTCVKSGSGSERTSSQHAMSEDVSRKKKGGKEKEKAEKGKGHVLMHRTSVWSPVCGFVC